MNNIHTDIYFFYFFPSSVHTLFKTKVKKGKEMAAWGELKERNRKILSLSHPRFFKPVLSLLCSELVGESSKSSLLEGWVEMI
jgi:hypothetical protein